MATGYQAWLEATLAIEILLFRFEVERREREREREDERKEGMQRME